MDNEEQLGNPLRHRPPNPHCTKCAVHFPRMVEAIVWGSRDTLLAKQTMLDCIRTRMSCEAPLEDQRTCPLMVIKGFLESITVEGFTFDTEGFDIPVGVD